MAGLVITVGIFDGFRSKSSIGCDVSDNHASVGITYGNDPKK
jgi:hypothetical protein